MINFPNGVLLIMLAVMLGITVESFYQAYLTIWNFYTLKQLKKSGVNTQAVIVECKKSRSQRNPLYVNYIIYKFNDEPEYTKKEYVSLDLYKKLESEKIIDISYKPDKPKLSLITGNEKFTLLQVVSTVCGFVLMFATIFFLIFNYGFSYEKFIAEFSESG